MVLCVTVTGGNVKDGCILAGEDSCSVGDWLFSVKFFTGFLLNFIECARPAQTPSNADAVLRFLMFFISTHMNLLKETNRYAQQFQSDH